MEEKIIVMINKNDVIKGKVIDLTHEGHGVIKLDRYPILFLMC